MANRYSQPNKVERDHLRAVVARLSDAQLALPAGAHGWTVGGLLAHVAFWDRRAVVLMERWKKGSLGSPPGDVDVVNDTIRPFLVALPPRRAAELALETAEAIDNEIDSLSVDMLERVEANGQPRLDRASHRADHLEQIEKAIR